MHSPTIGIHIWLHSSSLINCSSLVKKFKIMGRTVRKKWFARDAIYCPDKTETFCQDILPGVCLPWSSMLSFENFIGQTWSSVVIFEKLMGWTCKDWFQMLTWWFTKFRIHRHHHFWQHGTTWWGQESQASPYVAFEPLKVEVMLVYKGAYFQVSLLQQRTSLEKFEMYLLGKRCWTEVWVLRSW